MTLILDGEQRWACPNCAFTARTRGADNRFHTCSGLDGMYAPMILDGVRCSVRTVVREDYVGREDVRYDGRGRPVMAVVTEREDGLDRVVYAPSARVKGD